MHAFTLLTAMFMQTALADILSPLPQSADQRAIRFQPVLDYDKDVCFFTAAIDAQNKTNPGALDLATCHQDIRLDSTNAYVRSRCNHGWCAYMYAYYAERSGEKKGHEHDWQHAIAWTQVWTVGSEQLRSISWSNEGSYDTVSDNNDDLHLVDETHAKLVYHHPSHGTDELRLAKTDDEEIENPTRVWHQAPLVNITSAAPKLLEVEFGYAKKEFVDPYFARALKLTMPDDARNASFNIGRD